jgi:hypothetical protein
MPILCRARKCHGEHQSDTGAIPPANTEATPARTLGPDRVPPRKYAGILNRSHSTPRAHVYYVPHPIGRLQAKTMAFSGRSFPCVCGLTSRKAAESV